MVVSSSPSATIHAEMTRSVPLFVMLSEDLEGGLVAYSLLGKCKTSSLTPRDICMHLGGADSPIIRDLQSERAQRMT